LLSDSGTYFVRLETMSSLWLRIEQLDQNTGSIALFDVASPAPEHEPILAKPFLLAETRTQAWKDRDARNAVGAEPHNDLLENYGDALRKLLEPTVLQNWAQRRTEGTRTYLDI